MTVKATDLEAVAEGAQLLTEGGLRYAYFPKLMMPEGCVPDRVDTLVCMDPCGGYASRAFFAEQVNKPGRSPNWNGSLYLLGRNWVAFSWNNVRGDQHPVQVLAGHLDAFR